VTVVTYCTSQEAKMSCRLYSKSVVSSNEDRRHLLSASPTQQVESLRIINTGFVHIYVGFVHLYVW